MELKRFTRRIFSNEDLRMLIELIKKHNRDWKIVTKELNSETGKKFNQAQCKNKICTENKKDSISAYKKQYYQKNKTSHLEYCKQYYKENKDDFKIYNTEYSKKRREEKIKEQQAMLLNKLETKNSTSHVQQLEQNRQIESNDKEQINASDVFGFSYTEQNISFM